MLKWPGALIGLAASLSNVGRTFAAAWHKSGFESKSANDAIKAMGIPNPSPSKDILITAADIAEDGSQVPITVSSRIPNTQSMMIIVDKNPFPLNSIYEFSSGVEAYVSTEMKVAQSSNVQVIVKADGRYFTAVKEIKITIGGCG